MTAPVYESRKPEDVRDILDARYARFGLRPMSDADVWALSMAAMVMPDGNPGAEAYLAQVSGTMIFHPRLALWGRVVAIGIAQAGYKAPGGARRRSYVEGYDESWGRYAVADGLSLALYGKAERNAADRVAELGCGRQAYERIRDFVGGATVNAIAEYRVALEWACGYRRDRVLEGRWEGATGANWSDARADATMGREEGNSSPMFAQGCGRIAPLPDLDDVEGAPDNGRGHSTPPETLYHGLRPSDWWDSGRARLARDWPVTMIYPATD